MCPSKLPYFLAVALATVLFVGSVDVMKAINTYFETAASLVQAEESQAALSPAND